MNNQLTPEQTEQISEALASGRKIEAIKICREATGQGLKEAKEQVEEISAELVARDPVKYQKLASRGSGGCASVILLCGSLGWVAIEMIKSIG